MAQAPALPNLTSLRFFAALYVFIYHFVDISPYLSLGNTGVTLFFVLSGFILAYNYTSVPDKRRFFCYRIARIYPMYALALLLGLPQILFAYRHHLGPILLAIPLSFALLQTWFPPLRNALNASGWTLPVEMFFYLTFPFLLPSVLRQVDRWKLWIAALAVLLILPTAFMYRVVIPAFPTHWVILKSSLNMPIFHLGEFVMGMFFGARFLKTAPRFAGWQVLLGLVFLAVCTLFARHISWYYLELILDGLLAVPYGILIYLLAGWRSRWFAHPILQLGGEISYGMYLLQFPIGVLLERLWHTHNIAFGSVLLTLTIAVAYLCYLYFEKPARLWLLRAAGYHPTPKPIPTPGLQA